MKPKKSTARKTQAKDEIRAAGIPELLTGPALFAVLGACYVTIGTIAALDPAMQERSAIIGTTPLGYIVFIAGLLSFCLGVATSRHARRFGMIPIAAALFLGIIAVANILGIHPLLSAAVNLSALFVSYIMLKSKANWEWTFAAGALIFWANFAVNGMPALDVALHRELLRIVNPVFIAGLFIMLFSAAMLHPRRRMLWPFLIASLLLSTFRLYAGIALLAWIILEAGRAGRLHPCARKWGAVVVISSAAVAMLFLYTGQAIMVGNHDGWPLDPVGTLEHRLAFTVSVFDDIVHLSFPWGYTFGGSLSMESTEYTCRLLYGYGDRITSTTFGEAMLNFGIPGVLIAGWFAGFVIASLRRADYKVYAILLAIMIATLDVGMNAFVVMGLAYLGWLAVIVRGSEEETGRGSKSGKQEKEAKEKRRKLRRGK